MPKTKPTTNEPPVASENPQARTARVPRVPSSPPAPVIVEPTPAPRARTKPKAQPEPPPPALPTPPDSAPGKQEQVVSLLRRPTGATIAEMMAVTGWMSHSVRGLLSAGIKRKLGLMVTSAVEAERGRVYRIAPPAPVTPPPAPDRTTSGPANGATDTRVRRRRTPPGTPVAEMMGASDTNRPAS